MNRRALLAFALPLALVACAGAQAQHHPQRFSGVWDFHFETSSFRTEDGQGPWWLSAGEDGAIWPELTAPFGPTGSPWGALDIVVEGELSPPGHYGHLGAYDRELRVTRVISSRLHQPSGS